MTRIVKKPEERRAELIRTAREMFETEDYDKITMQDLMNRLNIAKGTIYHYFASKDELLEAVVESIVDQEFMKIQARMSEVADQPELDAVQKMKILIEGSSTADQHEHIMELLHKPGNAKLHLRQLARFLERLAPLYADVIAEGVSQGVFHTKHPLETAEFLLAGAQFITDVGFYPWQEDQLKRRAAAFPAIVEAQLGAPSGSFQFLAESSH